MGKRAPKEASRSTYSTVFIDSFFRSLRNQPLIAKLDFFLQS